MSGPEPDHDVRRPLPGLARLEVAPPAWLVRAVALKPAAVPWPETIQAVLAISVPLAAGAAVGRLSLSSFLGMGGLIVAMTNSRGPLRWKLRRSGTALAAGVLGLLAGLLTGAHPVTAVAGILVLSFVAALISVVGAIASVAALQLLVYAAIGGSLATRVTLAAPPPAMLAGGLWGLPWPAPSPATATPPATSGGGPTGGSPTCGPRSSRRWRSPLPRAPGPPPGGRS